MRRSLGEPPSFCRSGPGSHSTVPGRVEVQAEPEELSGLQHVACRHRELCLRIQLLRPIDARSALSDEPAGSGPGEVGTCCAHQIEDRRAGDGHEDLGHRVGDVAS